MSAESYLHKYAKTVMSSWLRKITGKKFKGLNNIGITIKHKHKAPMFGVFTEYPVCVDKQTNKIIGIEQSWESWITEQKLSVKAKHGIPTRWELKDWKEKCTISHIFDIVILDKLETYDNLTIAYIFEICNKHPIEESKIEFVKKYKIPCYEIEAQWIMEKCKLPANLETLRSF